MNNPRRIQRHLVKALAAGALLAAAALPMAIATSAGAAVDAATVTSVTFSTDATVGSVAADTTGTVTVAGTGFQGDGGTWTLSGTCNAHTLTLTGTETTSTTSLTGTFTAAALVNTDAGTCSLSLTEPPLTAEAGAASVTVVPQPDTTTASPSTIGTTQGATTVTLTNNGVGLYETGAKVSVVGSTTGVSLVVGATTVAAGGGSLTVSVTPTNSVTSAAAPADTYVAKVTNPDGGPDAGSANINVAAVTVTAVSPSEIANTATTTQPITITGTGFTAATVTNIGFAACSGPLTTGTVNFTNVTLVSGTEITATETVGATAFSAATTCPITASGGTLVGAIGVGEVAAAAPIVTASSSTATSAIVGGSAQTITVTGLGFGSDSTMAFTDENGAHTDLTVGGTCLESNGTSLACSVTATAGVIAGIDSVTVSNAAPSNSFADGLYVAGPVITSMAPKAIVDNAGIGSTIVLTGTGFTSAITSGSPTITKWNNGTLSGFVVYESATTANFVVTAISTADASGATAADNDTISVSNGLETSPAFAVTVDASPSVTGVTYATTNTLDGVGVGATATPIVIDGPAGSFQTGATVTAFTNATSVADPDVTVKVTGVNSAGTQLSATVAVAAGDTNTAVGYTVTNPDGGTATVAASGFSIKIDKAPVLTTVAPATATAGTPTSFTITGTGFYSGSTVALSSDGTCGPATFATPTSTASTLTVNCTIGAAPTAAVSIVVTNVDGGTASSVILPLAAPKPPVSFRVTGAHGTAIAGKTVTMTISGTGFYGQPKITSNAAGTKVGVSKDTGKLLTIRVTTKAGIRGEHTFTIRLANGKTGKANYAVKA